ncbi:metal ABC transporter permease [Candidatus Gottesmanbacteria bacterium]|nr:metal ABC transporter permease [Candidatus Gottesmanbacteria bacterium]
MAFFIEPFHYQFFVYGILAAVFVGATTGLLGTFIVLRKMSSIGHGLAHAVFGGAVVSYLLNTNFYIGASLWGFISSLLIRRISSQNKLGADAAIGIVTTASFALGVALISKIPYFTRNIEAALFGNVLGVTPLDIAVIVSVFAITLLCIFLFYRSFLFLTFNEEIARAYKVPVEKLEILFSLILAASIIVSIQVLGVTLVAAMVVLPASCARLLTNSFHRMIFLSVGIGIVCSFAGMYISYYLDIASGATIVLFAAFLFVVLSIYCSNNFFSIQK